MRTYFFFTSNSLLDLNSLYALTPLILIAEALGGYGELVEQPEDIIPALDRASNSGVPAIVNVHTDPTARALSKFVGSKME